MSLGYCSTSLYVATVQLRQVLYCPTGTRTQERKYEMAYSIALYAISTVPFGTVQYRTSTLYYTRLSLEWSSRPLLNVPTVPAFARDPSSRENGLHVAHAKLIFFATSNRGRLRVRSIFARRLGLVS